jgi:hypothetical protein
MSASTTSTTISQEVLGANVAATVTLSSNRLPYSADAADSKPHHAALSTRHHRDPFSPESQLQREPHPMLQRELNPWLQKEPHLMLPRKCPIFYPIAGPFKESRGIHQEMMATIHCLRVATLHPGPLLTVVTLITTPMLTWIMTSG